MRRERDKTASSAEPRKSDTGRPDTRLSRQRVRQTLSKLNRGDFHEFELDDDARSHQSRRRSEDE